MIASQAWRMSFDYASESVRYKHSELQAHATIPVQRACGIAVTTVKRPKKGNQSRFGSTSKSSLAADDMLGLSPLNTTPRFVSLLGVRLPAAGFLDIQSPTRPTTVFGQ